MTEMLPKVENGTTFWHDTESSKDPKSWWSNAKMLIIAKLKSLTVTV